MSSNAGGAATNSGIDFQQRISALFMTHMLMDVPFIDDLGMENNSNIQSLQFESDEAIDDLVVRTDLGTVYIQAKRSINCSQSEGSEFSKVIKQFVEQYSRGTDGNDKFVLATTSKASSKITRDLRKITESIKLNDVGFIENPLNQSEQSVYCTLTYLIGQHYLLSCGSEITEEIKADILRKIHVSVIDIEAGMPLEKAVMTLITGNAIVSAELLWSALISLGLSLSKDRASINKQGLDDRVGRFVGDLTQREKDSVKNNLFLIETKKTLSSGREVLIIESFNEDSDYMIVELIRFEEDGAKRLKFYENKVELLNGDTWNVLFRSSTYAAAERYITGNASYFENKKLTILPINSDEELDETPISLSHSELCQNIFKEKPDQLMCIHCGDPISNDKSPYIEIDERDSVHDVGFSHDECLSPTDRVLGLIDSALFKENPHIINFDYEAWYVAASKGQGFFTGITKLPKGTYPVAWKPNYSNINRGKYCVKINLEDGSSRYVHDRGRVVRETQDGAEEKCEFFNSAFKTAKDNKDPHCYTSMSEAFTTYSVAMQTKAEDEVCLVCINAEVATFTNAINKAYSAYVNYYAPLIMFLEKESGLPIVLDETMLLISSPLNLERYLTNWKKAGIELPDYTLSIIETDVAFDKLVSDYMSDGISIIIDPEVDMRGQMTSGLIIQNINEIISKPK